MQLAQPYDAPTILEIDPVTHTLETFGAVGSEECKWYGGVLAPNNKIYAIPYASQYVLEISPENRTASIFAQVGTGWGKWSGGVLAGNGKIYGIPSSSTSILEIDVTSGTITAYGHGMMPGGGQLADKWNGGVLAPNGVIAEPQATLSCGAPRSGCFTGSHFASSRAGKIYAIPWRSSSILEFDPETKVLRLFGSVTATNYTW